MKKSFSLSKETIGQNIRKLRELIKERELDGMYVSSFDPYLNEYVPLVDNHRFYVTGFTGSMAEVLIPLEGKVRLYVDGRYHEQADQEVNHQEIEVVKLGPNDRVSDVMVQDIKMLKLNKIAHEPDRTSLRFLKKLAGAAQEMVPLASGELSKIIEFQSLGTLKPVELIPRENRGRDTLEKTRIVFNSSKQAMYLTALDSIAWITNCRGYHLPFLSSFYAKALVTREKVYIFVTPETPVSDHALKETGLEWIVLPFTNLPKELERLQNTLHLEEVWYDSAMLNFADFSMLVKIFGTHRLKEKEDGLYPYQSIKEPVEIKQIDHSFHQSDKAIYNTIKWVKESIKKNQRITELDLYRETSVKYKEQGATELSFNTIAGVGANGSIIHYGSPSDEVVIKSSDMILLDSGGYFTGGWATDTTRTFFASSQKPDPKMIEIYTLVLKGLLAVQSAVFPVGTRGNVLDGLARNAMRKKGYDYSHGTGHGIGIHVHEPGVRLSSISDQPMKAGQVVSIEPGIYIPGFGGVRLENIVWVENHPEFKGMLRFVPFTTIGFDPVLVDQTLLNEEERDILEAYEAECTRRGTSLRSLC